VVRWNEVTEEGFTGGPVMPDDYKGSPQQTDQLRQNIARAQILGSLVGNDYRSSMIFVPLLDKDVRTGKALDYWELSRRLEDIRAKHAKAGGADIEIRIIGFAKVVGDLLDGLMQVLGYERFAVYGTDTGMPIAYAMAADHPERVERLVVSEAPLPGVTPSPPLFLPPVLNARLWHLAFNQLPAEVNEALVRGREEIFFGAEFAASAGTTKLPDEVVKYYIDALASNPDALRGSFGFYRAIPAIISQNEQRKNQRLTMPVLAIGGAESGGEGPAKAMQLVADNVQGVVLAGAGHWVAEQAPEQLLAALTEFLAPHQDAASRVAAVGAGS